MSRKKSSPSASDEKTAKRSGWESLTWDDLERWAGDRSVARGRAYQKQGRVKKMAISEDGRLVAFVEGGERYVTAVELESGAKKKIALDSQCTCPVGYNGCKHAVAVVAAYLQAVADGETVPLAEENDPRWKKLASRFEGRDDYDEDFEDEFEEDDFEEDLTDDGLESDSSAARKSSQRPAGKKQTKVDWDARIKEHIRGKSAEELAEILESLVERYPELREEFREQIALGEGDVNRLVAQARTELQELTAEIGWSNHWSGEGNTPDYSGFRHRLERLVSQGYCDAVVKLGRELLRAGMRQVEQSHDEGETAMEVSSCLPIVFEAVKKSSLADSEKILYAIDAHLEDGYDVVGDSTAQIFDASWPKAVWSAVADALAARLKKLPQKTEDDFSRNYRRDQITDWLLTALENAGREGEIRPIYESEARITGSYERVVRYLIEERQYDDAERWAREGIEKTQEKLPGIASSLLGKLCEVAEKKKQWDIVAAHAAWKFFERPWREGFAELVKQAERAKCGKAVEAAARRFLETGVSPFQIETKRKDQPTLRVDSAWPLPVPNYLELLLLEQRPRYGKPGPHYSVLLDMAIADKKPEEVLKWYDKMRPKEKQAEAGWGWHDSSYSDQVAAAVAKTHPERALEIYEQAVKANLPHTGENAYRTVAEYLKKMEPILKALGRRDEWVQLLMQIRVDYRNRPKFMELLDRMEGRKRTILESQKTRKRR